MNNTPALPSPTHQTHTHNPVSTHTHTTAGLYLCCRWYILAGNHDHLGNVSAEIAYTKQSDRWFYPSEWYCITNASMICFALGAGSIVIVSRCMTHTRTHPCSRYTFTKTIPGSSTTVQFVFIDTVVLAGLHIPGVTVGQPKMPDSAAWRQKAQDQWTWVNQTLQASTADWLIVAGHYPVWSIAEVQSVMGTAVLGSCAACEGARAHALGLD